ncbi:MAG TPA: type II secretion system protein GspK [Planctomycetota bacterium]|nr:type II secretion system protein GspK [Planctomycetota bacterium]
MQRCFSGIALIMSLLMIIILVVLVGQFSYSVKIDSFVAENEGQDVQLRYALFSATNYAIAQLQLDAMKEISNNAEWDAFTDEWATPLWSSDDPKQIGITKVYYTISDENSRFNLLNLIKEPKKKEKEKTNDNQNNNQENSNNNQENSNNNQENNSTNKDNDKDKEEGDEDEEEKEYMKPEAHLERCLNILLGRQKDFNAKKFRESIVKWMKEKKGDTEETAGPFPTKVPLYSVKELLMVPKIVPEYLFGKIDLNDPRKSFFGIEPFTTVWSDGLININTASSELLCSIHPKITPQISKLIIDHRGSKGLDGELRIFQKPEDIKKLEGLSEEIDTLYKDISSVITVKSSYFRIEAFAQAERLQKKLTTIVYRDGKKVYKLYCDFE